MSTSEAKIDLPLNKIRTKPVVDELAFLIEERKRLETRERNLKKVLKDINDKEGQTTFRGDNYNAVILAKQRTQAPSKDTIIRKTGKTWYENNSKTVEYQEIQIQDK